jgi:uncharacterized metal-binding protein YceD (DUF177 family)
LQSFKIKSVQKSILNTFKIDIFRLENKQYLHEFEGNDDFFEALDQNLIEKGHFKANVVLNKNETMIQMMYKITGSVELTCDRSLDLFDFPVDITQKMILKFSDHNEEITEELMLIDRNTQYINVAQDIFDFIGLQIPIKKLHPRFVKDEVTYESLMKKFEDEYEEEDIDDELDNDDDDFDFGDDDDNFEMNSEEEFEDEGEIVYSTIKNENQDDDKTTEVQKPIDPRWEALMKLNKN